MSAVVTDVVHKHTQRLHNIHRYLQFRLSSFNARISPFSAVVFSSTRRHLLHVFRIYV